LPFLQIEKLSHAYFTKGQPPVEALRDISFTVERGEYLALIGANGSGKTTLALHLNGILLPTKGTVRVDGLETLDAQVLREIRRKVGMVFQSPGDQIVATVVEEDVAFGPENLGIDEELLPELVRTALEKVEMWEERHRPPHMLSAGQQQRLAIAGALAMNPSCLVLDEATSMLDPAGNRDILAILETLNRGGMTVVTVTHRMEEAVRAERILVLNKGELVLEGTPGKVFSNKNLTSWGLHVPLITELAQRLKQRIPNLPEGILTPIELTAALESESGFKRESSP
jgi:energy-coupling factor transporter ATPase